MSRVYLRRCRKFEYLAARPDVDSPSITQESSFTSALILALQALLQQEPKGYFTTVELSREIQKTTKNLLRQQKPVLTTMGSNSTVDHITLYPLQNSGSEILPYASPDSGRALVDFTSKLLLTLQLEFKAKPSLGDIEVLGRGLNKILERNATGVERIHWGGFVQDQPVTVREIISQAISKNASPPISSFAEIVNISYHCCWELLGVLQHEHSPYRRLSEIITLTGTLEDAQMATCAEYLTQTWPEIGPFLLEIVEKALEDDRNPPTEPKLPSATRAEQSLYGSREMQLSVEKAPFIESERMCPMVLKAKGPVGFQVEIAEILAWLTAAIRVSSATDLKFSRAWVLQTQQSSNKDLEFRIGPEALGNGQYHTEYCWCPLALNSVIAIQFPTRKRFSGVGVDISPRLMAELAGAQAVQVSQRTYILKGRSTALIPVQFLRAEQANQWQLQKKESTDGVVQPGCLEAELGGCEIYQPGSVDDFWQYRAYLG